MGKYFLYRHIRLDKNEPFYIGVGIKKVGASTYEREYRRAFEYKYNRTKYWRNIVNSTTYEVEILMESDDFDFIQNKEIEFIKLYGRKDLSLGPLVNLTDGGSLGTMGLRMSKEYKEALSIKRKEEFRTGRRNADSLKKVVYQYSLDGVFMRKYNSISEAAKCIGIFDEEISRCAKGKHKIAGGFTWRYTNKENVNIDLKRSDHKNIFQYDLEGNFVREWKSKIEAAKSLNLKEDSIKSVLYNINKSSGGYLWYFEYKGIKIDSFKGRICIRKKKIIMLDLDNKVLQEFENITEAVKYINKAKCYTGISKCLSGSNKTAYGYIWKYKL